MCIIFCLTSDFKPTANKSIIFFLYSRAAMQRIGSVSAAFQGGEGVLCSFVASWWSLLWRVWGVGASTVIADRLFLWSRSTKGAMMCPSWPVAFYCDGGSAEQRWCRGIPQDHVGQVRGGDVIDIVVVVRWCDIVILCAWISKLSTYGIQT